MAAYEFTKKQMDAALNTKSSEDSTADFFEATDIYSNSQSERDGQYNLMDYMDLSAGGLVNGILYSEILGKPVSKRGLQRFNKFR